MSRRLAALNLLMALVARPRLARTQTAEEGEADFDRAASRVFRRPPHLCVIPDLHAPLPMARVTAGPVTAGPAILFLHGGAYFAGSVATHCGMMGRLSRLSGVEVIAPNYRLLQQSPFPAAFDDALAAWDYLRQARDPDQIVLAGDSAGGGLALALMAYVSGRGERPAGVVAFSPWTDLTLSGATLDATTEVLLPVRRMGEVAAQYLAGADPRDPRASPLFAAFGGTPPVLIQVGGGEALRDDAARMAVCLQEAGGDVTLEICAQCPHVWQIFDGWVPEARSALRRAAAFVQTSLASASR